MLPKKNRLKLNRDFSKVFKTGHSHYERFVGVKVKENKTDNNRFAIVVSNKINKSAVKRNYIKRKIKEIVEEINKNCIIPHDCVIIVLSDIKENEIKEVKSEINKIFKKLNLIT
jgi:ribonuclease P protein component